LLTAILFLDDVTQILGGWGEGTTKWSGTSGSCPVISAHHTTKRKEPTQQHVEAADWPTQQHVEAADWPTQQHVEAADWSIFDL